MEIIEKYPNKPWDWFYISKNPNITMEIIEKYPDKPWNWRVISKHPNITMESLKSILINLGIGMGYLRILILLWKL